MSEDGLRAALVAIKAKLQARSDEGEAHLFLNIPYWELEELLAEYPPHLTDDGATDTPPPVAAGAESATSTVAPSSPRLEELAVVIRRHTLFPADEVETRETCACGWRPTGNPMLAYSEHARHVRDALVAAGFFGEGAAPAIDREQIAAELEKHGVLLFDQQPHCRCGHVYEPAPFGGVAWDLQNKHRADAVLALIGGAQ